MTFVPVLVTPESRGTVRLRSKDPTLHAAYDPNYLSSPSDMSILIWGFKRLRASVLSDSFSPVRVREVYPGANVTSDSDIEAVVKQSLATIHHVCGTAAMSSSVSKGVVDSNLRVFGVHNLRIVDASIIPTIPTVQIQSAVYAIAEHASDIIRRFS